MGKRLGRCCNYYFYGSCNRLRYADRGRKKDFEIKTILTYFTPSALRRAVGLQFVYCMAIIPPRERWWHFRWVVKFGLSDSPFQRRKNVETDLRAYTSQRLYVYVFPLPVFAPKQCEWTLQTVTRKIRRDPFPNTTGGTEWVLLVNLLCGFGVFLYAYADGMPFTAALGWWALVALLPVPFDAALLVLLVAAIHWGLFVGALWGAGKILLLCGAFG